MNAPIRVARSRPNRKLRTLWLATAADSSRATRARAAAASGSPGRARTSSPAGVVVVMTAIVRAAQNVDEWQD